MAMQAREVGGGAMTGQIKESRRPRAHPVVRVLFFTAFLAAPLVLADIAFSQSSAPERLAAADVLAAGRMALDDGRPDEALAYFEQTLRTNPDERQAIIGRAKSLDLLGRVDEAIAVYDAILVQDPEDGAALFYRGVARYHLGEFDGAEADLLAAINAGLGFSVLYQRLGDVYYARGDLDAALEAYESGLSQKDPHPSLQRAIGNVRYAQREYELAEAAYGEALRLAPADGYAAYYRAWSREKLGRPFEALADYDVAYELIGAREARVAIDRGTLLLRSGAAAAALEDFRAALDLEPENPAALYGAALALLDQGQSVAAEDMLDTLVVIVGDNRRTGAAALFQRGRARILNEDFKGALADLDLAISIAPAPGDADAHFNRALVRAHLDDPAGALDDLQKAAALRPDDAEIHYALARAAIVAGLPEIAREAARTAEALILRAPSARRARAVTLMSLGRPQAALRDLEAYLGRAPRDAGAIMLAAEALLRLGRFDDALVVAKQLVARAPRNPQGPLLEAEAYIGLADTENARAALNRANQLDAPLTPLTRLAGEMWLIIARKQDAGTLPTFAAQAGSADQPDLALEQAEVALDQAVEQSNNSPGILVDRAKVRIELGKLTEAREDLDRAIALRPQDAELRFLRASVLVSLDLCEDAIRDYDAGLSMRPDNASARSARADCKIDEGRYLGAIGDYVGSWF